MVKQREFGQSGRTEFVYLSELNTLYVFNNSFLTEHLFIPFYFSRLILLPVVTPPTNETRSNTTPTSDTIRTDSIMKSIPINLFQPTRLNDAIFSIPHMLQFATRCLQSQTGSTNLRQVGIIHGLILQSVHHSHMKLTKDGYDRIKYEFPVIYRHGHDQTPIVKFDAGQMLELGKHPLYSPEFNHLCSIFIEEFEQEYKVGLKYRHQLCRPNVVATGSILQGNNLLNSIVYRRETCFVLPFRTTPLSGANLLEADTNCRELNSRLSRLGRNDAYFENSVHDILGKYSIIVRGLDFLTLSSGSWLNDSIINFFMKWLMFQRFPGDKSSKVHAFSTYFLSLEWRTDEMKRWLRKAGDIFDKKFLLFPCHEMGHWSLLVVVNPGKIMQTYKRWGDTAYKGEVAGMFHLDPLGSRGHMYKTKQSFARTVRNALNAEWDDRHNNGMDRLARPFTHRDSFKLHCPIGKYLHVDDIGTGMCYRFNYCGIQFLTGNSCCSPYSR